MGRINKTGLVLIGGSAGSLNVLFEVIPALAKSLNFPIVIVLHRKPYPDSLLRDLFSHYTDKVVYEIEDKMQLEVDTIYIAPPDYHILFEDKFTVSLDASEKLNYSRPSIDIAFHSASEIFEQHLVAVLLSGANADGAEGLQYVAQNKGTIVVQNPESAEVEYMPKKALEKVTPEHILLPGEIALFINNLSD